MITLSLISSSLNLGSFRLNEIFRDTVHVEDAGDAGEDPLSGVFLGIELRLEHKLSEPEAGLVHWADVDGSIVTPAEFLNFAFLDEDRFTPDDRDEREHLLGVGIFELFGVVVIAGAFDEQSVDVGTISFWRRTSHVSWGFGSQFSEDGQLVQLEAFRTTLDLLNGRQIRLWVEQSVDVDHFHVLIWGSREFFQLRASVGKVRQPTA